MKIRSLQKFIFSGSSFALVGYSVVNVLDRYKQKSNPLLYSLTTLPTRDDHLKALKSRNEYDVLVIGGGATGAGVALDATTRGLKTALIEFNDFGSGTSSKSSKLIHGGLRYLKDGIENFDLKHLKMVRQSLYERSTLLTIAPHLVHTIPIMIPMYSAWQIPYFWMGIKVYELISGSKNIGFGYFLSRKKALDEFPALSANGFKGAIVFYDCQQNDARMNIDIIVTAAKYGANVANHVEVVSLLKKFNESGIPEVSGVKVKDTLTGQMWDISSKCVINATGPYIDIIRKMDSEDSEPLCQPSSGVHIILPKHYSPDKLGLLNPFTSDGRILFILPWENKTLVGTTDKECDVTFHPLPKEPDIDFLLEELKRNISPEVGIRRGDVIAAWCGIRPLVHNPEKKSTKELERNHIIEVSTSKLITIAGGKWTTYRSMAKHTVDKAIQVCNLQPERKCCTSTLVLEGGKEWSPILPIKLTQEFGFERDISGHLSNTYGTNAYEVAKMCALTGQKRPLVGKRLHHEYPYLEAEVNYAIKEYACTAIDVVARRLRMSFLDAEAAIEVLPRIIDIMSKELQWEKTRQDEELAKARDFIRFEMGQDINRKSVLLNPPNLTSLEKLELIEKFRNYDIDKKGYLDVLDLQRILKAREQDIPVALLEEIISEVSLENQSRMTLDEYLQLMERTKSGSLTHNRMATLLKE